MPAAAVAGLLWALVALPCAAGAAPLGPEFVRGISLGMYNDTPEHLDAKLDEVKALGVSHVSLVVSWSQQDVHSSSIAPRKGYATPDGVLEGLIRSARAKGLAVFLFPILEVQKRTMGQWRGTISPAKWGDWWRGYDRFILHYAGLAGRNKVDLFCVGSELVSTEKMRGRWTSLISRVRKVFGGKLAYSANWDHYRPVTFWDQVDVMGLTAYYKVARRADTSEQEMVRAWPHVRRRLEQWSVKQQRKFIFTEVGYPSRDGGAKEPWDYTRTTKPDLEEQRRAYSAFVKAWSGSPRLAGVFFWDWYGKGGKACTRYTPRGKPAAAVIRRWYGK